MCQAKEMTASLAVFRSSADVDLFCCAAAAPAMAAGGRGAVDGSSRLPVSATSSSVSRRRHRSVRPSVSNAQSSDFSDATCPYSAIHFTDHASDELSQGRMAAQSHRGSRRIPHSDRELAAWARLECTVHSSGQAGKERGRRAACRCRRPADHIDIDQRLVRPRLAIWLTLAVSEIPFYPRIIHIRWVRYNTS